MDALAAVIAFLVGVGGVALGAMLARRNDRRAQADRLLVEALNDAVHAIASVAGGAGPEAQRHYAGAVARVALHGSPTVVAAFRRFQDDATTITDEGRARLIATVKAARAELGHRAAADEDLHVLLFGAGPINVKTWDQEAARVAEHVVASSIPTTAEEDEEVERLMALADTRPDAAVFESFSWVERELRAIAARAGLGEADRMGAVRLAEDAARTGATTHENAEAIRGLSVLRNLAAHGGPERTTSQKAREFVVLAHAVVYALRSARPGDG